VGITGPGDDAEKSIDELLFTSAEVAVQLLSIEALVKMSV